MRSIARSSSCSISFFLSSMMARRLIVTCATRMTVPRLTKIGHGKPAPVTAQIAQQIREGPKKVAHAAARTWA